MNRLFLIFFFLFALHSSIYSQEKIDYKALLTAIPDFTTTPADSMDQEWAVKNNVVPPITKSDAEFELRYFVHGIMYYQGLIVIIKGYRDRFSVEKIGFEASTKAPSHWERIKLLDGFTGPKDIVLWRYHSKLKPKNGWTEYITGIVKSEIFSEPPPFNEFIEIKKGKSFKRIMPMEKGETPRKKLLPIFPILSEPLEPEGTDGATEHMSN